jgi:hypothetical protein
VSQLEDLYIKAEMQLAEGNEAEALTLFREASSLDPLSLPVHHELLNSGPEKYRVRRVIASFCAERLENLQNIADQEKAPREPFSPKLFMYWAQGFDRAPPIVQACFREVQRLHDKDDVVLLTDENIADWVDMPAQLVQNLEGKKTFFSDVLRLALLAKHGGIWMDATCYLREPILHNFDAWSASGYFALSAGGPGRFSNWLLASPPAGRLVVMMRELLFDYYSKYKKPLQYFMFHHMVEALYYLDAEVRKICEQMPVLSGWQPRRLQHYCHKSIENRKIINMYRSKSFHKISYKKVARKILEENSLYNAIVCGDYALLGDS